MELGPSTIADTQKRTMLPAARPSMARHAPAIE